MKKCFEGVSYKKIPDDWDNYVNENPWMYSKVLEDLNTPINEKLSFVLHKDYSCCEYRMKLNILTFSRLKLSIPFHIIGLPASVSGNGFCGNLEALIRDYQNRKGLFLILNLDSTKGIPKDIASGQTLPTCIFDNLYDSFEQYISCLKSSYRRRVTSALKKGQSLKIRQISGSDFTPEMYRLYMNVLHRAKYPLETLAIEFFRHFDAQYHILYSDEFPVAFVMTKRFGSDLHFMFGGMDYAARDQFDLYYNMLLTIVKIGIEEKVSRINLGQTAESAKCRIGCHIQEKSICAFSGSRFVNRILKLFSGLLEYDYKPEGCEALKND